MIQKIANLASLEHFFTRYPCYAQRETPLDANRISAAWHLLLAHRVPAVQGDAVQVNAALPHEYCALSSDT